MHRCKLVALFVLMSVAILSSTGCGRMNAAMSAAVMLGAAAAGYGAYYYFYEYQEAESSKTELKVVNDSSDDLKIWVDGTLLGTVDASTEQTFEITPGSHALAAGVDSQTITTTQTFTEGAVFTWTLTD